jgi:hypothetical protein
LSPVLPIVAFALTRSLIGVAALAALGRVALIASARLRTSSCPKAPFARWFTFLSVGTAVFVTLFALVTTGGFSVLWCFVAAFIGLLVLRDGESASAPSGEPAPRPGVSRWAAVTLAFCVLSVWTSLNLFRPGPFPFQIRPPASMDAAYYSAAARALVNAHLESGAAFEAELDPKEFSPEPYHFFELWLAAGISKLSGASTYVALFFDVPIILGMSWILGVLAVAEALGALFWRTLVGTLLFVAFAPLVAIPGLMTNRFLSGGDLLVAEGAALGHVSPGRLLPGYILVIGAAVLATYGRPRRALAMLGLAPAVNPTLLALPLGGIVAFLVVARREYAVPRRFLRVVLPCAALVAIFWCFCAVYSRILPPDILPDLLDLSLLRTKRYIVATSLMQCFVVYGPYLAFVAAGGAAAARTGAWLAAATTGIGLLGWVATYPLIDSYQFYLNPTIVVLNSLVLLGILLAHRRVARTVGLAVIAVVAIVHGREAARRPGAALPYAEEYLAAVKAATAQLAGGFVVPDEILHSQNVHALYLRTNFMPYLEPLGTARGVVALVDVVPFAPWPANEYRYEDLLFRRFLARYGVPTEPHIAACLQEAFVDHYHLDFVILEGSAAEPPWLARREQRRISDRVSGDRFVLLDKEKRGTPPEECPYAMARAAAAGAPASP